MDWDDWAEGWDEDEGARAYSEAAFRSLSELCESRSIPLRGARVCDFGCGTGLLTEKLIPLCSEVFAVDTSRKMLEVLDAKVARLGASNVHTSTELPESLVDIVVCSSVCAFVDDYPASVGELTGILKPGGLFVQWDWELDPDADEPFGLTRVQIREALGGAGLESIVVDTGFTLTFGDQTMQPIMGVGQTCA